jgi:hypothetical protein
VPEPEQVDLSQLAEELAEQADSLRKAADQIEPASDADKAASDREEMQRRLAKVDESIERLRRAAKSAS